MKEADVQHAILDYLRYQGHFHFRLNTGAYRTEHGAFVRYGSKGAPDIIVVDEGIFIGIEVKGPKGRLSPDQEEFSRSLVAAGGRYIIAQSIDDVIAAGL